MQKFNTLTFYYFFQRRVEKNLLIPLLFGIRLDGYSTFLRRHAQCALGSSNAATSCYRQPGSCGICDFIKYRSTGLLFEATAQSL